MIWQLLRIKDDDEVLIIPELTIIEDISLMNLHRNFICRSQKMQILLDTDSVFSICITEQTPTTRKCQ